MNDEIKARLVRYADQLESAASKGADFVSEQAPETVHQYLAWHLWSSIIEAVACALMFALFLYLALRMWAWLSDESKAAIIFPCMPIVVGFVGFWVNSMNALQIVVAPNVFIIEQLARLAKSL